MKINRTALFFTIILILLVSLTSCFYAKDKSDIYSVYAVIDGDTVILSNAKNVRYLGVDAPELRKKVSEQWVYNPQPYAEEALKLNKELAEGKSVRLEFDSEREDRYGRWLAYVFVGDKMVNEELIRQGYAKVYARSHNLKYEERLKAAETEAKINQRGLWSKK